MDGMNKFEQRAFKIAQFKSNCRNFMEDMVLDFKDIIVQDSVKYDEKVSWKYNVYKETDPLILEKPATRKITISFEIANE